MKDLEKAKEIYLSDDYSCVLCRGNSVFTSKSRGINRLVNFCSDGDAYDGFSAADKIVGRAAAFLYVKMGVRYVYAEVLSRKGREILEKYGIFYEYKTLCDEIINRAGTGKCPMEAAVENAENPEKAYQILLNKISEKC